MAIEPAITGAPARAPLLRPDVSRLEDIAGDFSTMHHVLEVAADCEAKHTGYLVEAALFLAAKVGADLESLIRDRLADRGEG